MGLFGDKGIKEIFGAGLGGGIDVEPSAIFGALVVVRWGEDVDQLSDFLGLEIVDIAGLGGEGGDLIRK